ncbi:MAG: hypothetical protein Kow0075_14820 [Salibacteraceae bacterium]
MKISASIYSVDNRPLPDVVRDLDTHGIDYLHIDCRDSVSVFDDIEEIKTFSRTPIDLHLITNTPEKYFDRINQLGIDSVTLQYEDLDGYTYRGGLQAKVGLGITSTTDVLIFDPRQYEYALLMATVPGHSGGRFNKLNFRKVRQFKATYPGKEVRVDGGVNAEVSFILRNLGVDVAVVGSYLFQKIPLGAALLNLKSHDIESHYLVEDFMRIREESPIVGPSNRDLKTVLQCVEDHKLGFAILEDDHQRLQGIVSNADIRRELLRNVDDPTQIQLSNMINPNPITVSPRMTVSDLLSFVKRFDFPLNYLPVVDENQKVCGVVSFLNLVKGE